MVLDCRALSSLSTDNLPTPSSTYHVSKLHFPSNMRLSAYLNLFLPLTVLAVPTQLESREVKACHNSGDPGTSCVFKDDKTWVQAITDWCLAYQGYVVTKGTSLPRYISAGYLDTKGNQVAFWGNVKNDRHDKYELNLRSAGDNDDDQAWGQTQW
ncbi:hypothetical protein BDV95DRAFT_582026 [Massariosphaeria phaeospora]|uniref:Uncharacterized protein n=1 Tax=Massariosphaeria phaeospora TaxID=100035 RepID=A0A7C8I4Z9_9PLEO|nr:hypothetical protein BDV95DRAFT_582026 [Massariosphaeria phaeospora]